MKKHFLDEQLRQQFQRLLGAVDDHDTPGPRLLGDGERLWQRVRRFFDMQLITTEDADLGPLEVACYALQLPMRGGKTLLSGRLGRTNLRERAEQAAELLVTHVGGQVDEVLLDRTTRLLHELPHRPPVPDEAKLLADAINLEDFGIVGFVGQTIQMARQGDGVNEIADGCRKREQYGYWHARLKDGFNFDLVRQLAEQRLEHLKQVCSLLDDELAEDQL